MKWQPLGGGASKLTDLYISDLSLTEDFWRFKKNRTRVGACVTGGVLSVITCSIAGIGYALSRLEEYPGGIKPEHNNSAQYVMLGSMVSTIGFSIAAGYFRKKSRFQLVNLINRYNDHRLSAVPFPSENGWSLHIGFSSTGNSVGVGLHLRPN
ncbi:MAG TPA: hypothetical protein PLO67_12030 [Saprospiraceae bacterium]|nr:hypothetical protein [Saprospiraceae bacterium]